MTAIPQMDCCTMLGIDPKTLRNWRESGSSAIRCSSNGCTPQMFDVGASPAVGCPPCSPHRATCCRFSGTPARSHPACFDAFAPLPHSEGETQLACATPAFSEEAELRKVVCDLEAKVMTLQEHLTQLSLELLRERVSAV
jgi:hypothetical protein